MDFLCISVLKEKLKFKKSIDKDIINHCKKYINVDYYNLLLEKNRLNLYNRDIYFIFFNIPSKDIEFINVLKILYDNYNIKKAEKRLDKFTFSCYGNFELAKINHINKNFQKAITLYKKCMEYNNEEIKIIVSYYLGFLYQELGDYNNMTYYYSLYKDLLNNKGILKNLLIYILNSLLNLASYYQFILKDYNSMDNIYKIIISKNYNSYYFKFILMNTYLLYGYYYENKNFYSSSISLYVEAIMKDVVIKNYEIDMYNIYKRIIYITKNEYYFERFIKSLYNFINKDNIIFFVINFKLYDIGLLTIKNILIDSYLTFNDIYFYTKIYFILGYLYKILNKKDKSKDYNIKFIKNLKYLTRANISKIENYFKLLNIKSKDLIDLKNIIKIARN